MKIFVLITALLLFQTDSSKVISDFKSNGSTDGWFVVNDGVMGGLSKGKFGINESGNAEFKGYVTTENNGGFSSIRFGFDVKDVSKFETIVIKLKGDGKNYQFRLKESQFQRESYVKTFETSGEWETIEIPFKEFYPSFRGYKLNRPNYPGNIMSEVGILIGNKTKEQFKLEIDKISLQ